ncbi:MAG: DNA mismatch repair endonuclease MutL [Thermodesulfobacteriota bacterium]|nr:DNA mismatch repair endonuclease MutL [Thermodesulfobacteriota bacterium]
MSKIKILSENLASQIAAGEVIERPASVVKELIENSIDAGARNVVVQIEGAGTRLIRIIDDGEGMDQDDVLLCLESHATSKIISQNQLAAIRTLGFRGEAIPSIASVSRLNITSRRSSDSLGTRAEVRFGKLLKVHEMGCSQGTIMEVRDLFGNVPARKKFLKTIRTELSHIEEMVGNYALSSPDLGLVLSVNGRNTISLPSGADTLKSRVKRLIYRRATGSLIQIGNKSGIKNMHGEVTISGYLLPPDEARPGSSKLRLFVNGRSVRDRMITHAVAEGLRGFLMKGRTPSGIIFIQAPPDSVDVNVHPAKQEIRFHKSNIIHRLVVLAVSRGIKGHQDDARRSLFRVPSNADHVSSEDISPGQMSEPEIKYIAKDPPTSPCSKESWPKPPVFSDISAQEPSHSVSGSESQRPDDACDRAQDTFPPFSVPTQKVPVLKPMRKSAPLQTAQPSPALLTPPESHEPATRSLTSLGQVLDSYILCKCENGFVVIDQHAAHERIIFETLKKQFQGKGVASQILMFPMMMECDSAQINILEQNADEIAKLGIEISEFGGGSYACRAIPAIMSNIPSEEIMRGIFEQFQGDTEGWKSSAARIDNVLAGMACKAAIKANHPMQAEEIDEILNKMQKSDLFTHCPHGRPVYKYFSDYDIRKWFHRT